MFGFLRPSNLRPTIKKTVEETLVKELDRQLPKLVETILREKFKREPHKQLSRIGFTWALVLGFEDVWPEIGRAGATSCANDCLEIPYGTAGYDWSAAGANELVRDYVSAFGEIS